MATKPQWVHLKRCECREPNSGMPVVGRRHVSWNFNFRIKVWYNETL